jgi:methylated-DNA-protein-cysteine methyltransferase-like protein
MKKTKSSASFFRRVVNVIKKIPRGKVATYGQIAALAGNPRGARQVAWVLHSASDKEKLPWQRVINSKGTISLPRYGGYELQKALLVKEKIKFDGNDGVDLARFQWRPKSKKEKTTRRLKNSTSST